jgi:hypothetical protein
MTFQILAVSSEDPMTADSFACLRMTVKTDQVAALTLADVTDDVRFRV